MKRSEARARATRVAPAGRPGRQVALKTTEGEGATYPPAPVAAPGLGAPQARQSLCPPSYLNAYYDQGHAVFVSRDPAGQVKLTRRRADKTCFLKFADLDAEELRYIESHPKVRESSREGDWLRIQWRDGKYAEGWMAHQHKAGATTYEGTISPIRRMMADEQATIAKPLRCYLDIETDSRVTPARAAQGDARILCWSLVDSDGAQHDRVIDYFDDEAEADILAHLWALLLKHDQACAWYGDGFDFPVIKLRSRQLLDNVPHRQILWCDQLAVFERMNKMAAKSGNEKTSLKLQDIATELLGFGKHPFNSARTWEAWENDVDCRAKCMACRSCLVRYCAQDTALLPAIEEKVGYLELLQTLCEATGAFPNTSGSNPGNQVENYLLRLGVSKGFHFPTVLKTASSNAGDQYKGAFVMEPTRVGILQDVHVADFARLYPSIIQTWNMSPETRVATRLEEGEKPPRGIAHAVTGTCFDTTKLGLLPLALEEILRLRFRWKKEQNAHPENTPSWIDAYRRSTAYKIAANSFYGVVGSPMSRFFDRGVAEAVTQCGVWLIKETIAEAERSGFDVLYSDSVTGDRVVVVQDPTGEVRLLPIAELWELSCDRRQARGKEHGVLPRWLAMASDGASGWFPIDAVIRHRAGKPTFRLTTKHGQTQVTEDHGIMVAGEERSPVEFVRDGLEFTKIPPHAPRGVERLDLLSHLTGYQHRFTFRGREVVRRFVAHGDDRIAFDGWGRREGITVRRFYDRNSEELDALLRLVAAYVCDGSASIKGEGACRHMLSFCKANHDLMVQLAEDLALISDGAKVYGPYWTETVYVVRSGTAALAGLFAALCGAGCKRKRLPSFALDLYPDQADILIDGLAKGDGHVDAAGQLSFTSTSQQLIAGVSYVLAQHDRPHSFYFRESKKAWSLRTRGQPERRSRCKIKLERFASSPDEWVYDLSVRGAHTFVDGVGRILLHNTDSLLVTGQPGLPREQVRIDFGEFVARCNAELYPRLLKERGCAKNTIELAFEKSFSRLLLVKSKRYAASFWNAESAPEIKGLEFKRGDTTKLARDMQQEVVYAIMGFGRERADSPGPLVEIVERWRKKVVLERLPREAVMMTRCLSKPIDEYKQRMTKAKPGQDARLSRRPPHVEIAADMREKGLDVQVGVRIEFFCRDGSRSPKQYLPAEEWDKLDSGDPQAGPPYDQHALWEDFVWPASRRVLEAAFPEAGDAWKSFDRTRPKKPRQRSKPVPVEQTAIEFEATRVAFVREPRTGVKRP